MTRPEFIAALIAFLVAPKMMSKERQALLRARGLTSASCLLCGQPDPPVAEFDFDSFWVRDTKDWPDYKGGPVHRVCADIAMRKKRNRS